MPNQRIPPPPNDLQNVRQQLNRRLAGQADLMQAARRAALKIRERFRRAPRNPQEGRTETRTTRDVRSTSAPPRPNPTPMDLTVRSQWHGPPPPPPPRASNEGPPSDTDRNHIDLDAPMPLNLDHRRPSRNNCSRHHGVANAGELPTRRPASADIGGEPKTSTLSPRDTSPTAPPPKDEASTHGGTRAPTGRHWQPEAGPRTRKPPPTAVEPGHKKPASVVRRHL
jgi:hypothetical protein